MLDAIIHNDLLSLAPLALFVAVGLMFSLRLGFPQFGRLKVILGETLGAIRESSLGFGGLITPFQSAMLGQAFVLGNGHILGVVTAILAGGPGAVVWMWLAYGLGMTIQFGEAILAVHFRRQFEDKGVSGGPVYSISRGLGERWKGLAWVYACLISLALLGTGALFQSGTASNFLYSALHLPPALSALVLAIGMGVLSVGGVRWAARAATFLVPLSLLVFLLAVVPLLVVFAPKLPGALALIFGSALTLKAAVGGAVGLAILKVVSAGLGQGILSSTAGLGLTSMALSQAQVDHPVRQGFWGVVLTLVSLVVSTLMALVFVASGVWQGFAGDAAAAASSLFQSHFLGSAMLALLVLVFALSSLVASVFLGEEGFVYILGEGFRIPYRVLFATMVFIGPLGGLQAFVGLSHLALAVAALINLLVLFVLGKVVMGLMHDFFNGEPWFPPGEGVKKPRKARPEPVQYDDSELLEA